MDDVSYKCWKCLDRSNELSFLRGDFDFYQIVVEFRVWAILFFYFDLDN